MSTWPRRSVTPLRSGTVTYIFEGSSTLLAECCEVRRDARSSAALSSAALFLFSAPAPPWRARSQPADEAHDVLSVRLGDVEIDVLIVTRGITSAGKHADP